jgi:hypothetical protein
MSSLSLDGFGLGTAESAADELAGLPSKIGKKRAHDPVGSRVHAGEHLAQLALHTDSWGSQELFHYWFLFDDLWAAEHEALAGAVLRWAARWDVLT